MRSRRFIFQGDKTAKDYLEWARQMLKQNMDMLTVRIRRRKTEVFADPGGNSAGQGINHAEERIRA